MKRREEEESLKIISRQTVERPESQIVIMNLIYQKCANFIDTCFSMDRQIIKSIQSNENNFLIPNKFWVNPPKQLKNVLLVLVSTWDPFDRSDYSQKIHQLIPNNNSHWENDRVKLFFKLKIGYHWCSYCFNFSRIIIIILTNCALLTFPR